MVIDTRVSPQLIFLAIWYPPHPLRMIRITYVELLYLYLADRTRKIAKAGDFGAYSLFSL